MPAYHCSSSFSAPRNRSSPAIRKVPRQMAAVKTRTRNQRPRLLTVLRSRRATRPPLSWTAKLIPRSTCLSRDGSSWRSLSLCSSPGIIGYCGTWSCICKETLTASEWPELKESVVAKGQIGFFELRRDLLLKIYKFVMFINGWLLYYIITFTSLYVTLERNVASTRLTVREHWRERCRTAVEKWNPHEWKCCRYWWKIHIIILYHMQYQFIS